MKKLMNTWKLGFQSMKKILDANFHTPICNARRQLVILSMYTLHDQSNRPYFDMHNFAQARNQKKDSCVFQILDEQSTWKIENRNS